MMQEQNNSRDDSHNISFDMIYPDYKQNHLKNTSEKLIINESQPTFCDRCCLWWFFHSSLGIYKESSKSEDNRRECICCDFCIWCFEFRLKNCRCCIKECGCCCITCSC